MSTFKVPIGTDKERDSGIVWPGAWSDATPYLTHYSLGYHTGADLNNNYPGHWDADAHSRVCAIGDGKVTYAQRFPNPKYWGNIIVIDHGIVDGRPLFTRYGHVENIKVSVGQLVHATDQIASVGNGEGLFAYHLHFDISITDILRNTAHYWPGEDKKNLQRHFVDPKAWLRQPVHIVGAVPDKVDPVVVKPIIWYVIAPAGSPVRKAPSQTAEQVGLLPFKATLSINMAEGVTKDSCKWGHIVGGQYDGYWLALGRQDQTETYVSTNPPR